MLIRPVARRHPGLFDHRDANWIECDCRIRAGAFHGEIRTDLRSDELGAFLDELRALQQSRDGRAALTPGEGSLALTLQDDARDRLRVSGEAVDDGNRLQFHFEIEPLSLASICETLEGILTVFPVVAAPEV